MRAAGFYELLTQFFGSYELLPESHEGGFLRKEDSACSLFLSYCVSAESYLPYGVNCFSEGRQLPCGKV